MKSGSSLLGRDDTCRRIRQANLSSGLWSLDLGLWSRPKAENQFREACSLRLRFQRSLARFVSQHGGQVMEQHFALALRQRAVAALEISTTMLQVAQNLFKQGNKKEAARLRNEARYKRNESILLLDQATAAEQRRSNILRFTARKAALESVSVDETQSDETQSDETQSVKTRNGRRAG